MADTKFRSRGKGSNRRVYPLHQHRPESFDPDAPGEMHDHEIPFYLKTTKSFAKRFAYLALMTTGIADNLKDAATFPFVYPYFFDTESGEFIPPELAKQYMGKKTKVGFAVLYSLDEDAEHVDKVDVIEGWTIRGKWIHPDYHTNNFKGMHFPERWSDMMEKYSPIPDQLEDYDFMRIGVHRKAPFDPNWETENNFPWGNPRLSRHITEGGNYGVLLGPYEDSKGPYQLIVVDADTPELNDHLKDMVKTFTVGHDGGGAHYYFKVRGDDEKITKTVIRTKDKKTHLGDLMGYHSQVVGPGSIHENGSQYRVVDPSPMKEMSKKSLDALLSGFKVGR